MTRKEASIAGYEEWMAMQRSTILGSEPTPTGSLKKALEALKRRSRRREEKEAWCQRPSGTERVAPGRRQKRRKRHQLSVLEKLQIVHQVLVENDSQAAVAKEFRTSQCVVSQLTTTATKRPGFLKELVADRNEAEQ